jgi:hypothetical protein
MPILKRRHTLVDRYYHSFSSPVGSSNYLIDFGLDIIGGGGRVLEPQDISFNSREKTYTHPEIKTQPFAEFADQIKKLLALQNPRMLASYLRTEIMIEPPEDRAAELKLEYEHRIDVESGGETQGHHYTYQTYFAQPIIEKLVTQHQALFLELIQEAQALDLLNGNRNLELCLIQQLYNLDLSKADFRKLNLQEANLSGSVCDGTLFNGARLSKANLNATQLQKSTVSVKQLADAYYECATLPPGFWSYLPSARVLKLRRAIATLHQHGVSLLKARDKRGQEILRHAESLAAETRVDAQGKPLQALSEVWQKRVWKILHSADKIYKDYPRSRAILANVALCLLTGVVPYLIAAGIQRAVTGHFGFFREVQAASLVKKIDASLSTQKPKDDPMLILASGLHRQTGKSSTLYLFWGQDRNANNLGDPNVFRLVRGYLR